MKVNVDVFIFIVIFILWILYMFMLGVRDLFVIEMLFENCFLV